MHKKIRETGLALLALTLALAAGGCGGGGGGQSPTHMTVASPYAGEWQGDWTDSVGHFGTIRAVVGRDGELEASLTDELMDTVGSGEGRVQNDGRFILQYDWDTATVLQGSGTLVRNSDGTVRTTMVSQRDGHTAATSYLDLRPISD